MNKMLNIKKYLIALPVVGLFMLSSCQSMKEVHIGNIEGFKIDGMAGQQVFVTLKVPVENQRLTGFRIVEMDFKAHLNDVYIGKVTNREKIKVKGHSKQTYDLPLKIKLPGLFGALGAMAALKSGKGDLALEGEMKLRYCLMLPKTIQVKETHSINMKSKW